MTYLFDIKTVQTPTVMPPKPDRPRMMGFTMAQLQADAAAIRKRQSRTWGHGIAKEPVREPTGKRTTWTPDRVAAFEAEIIRVLKKHGSMSSAELLPMIRGDKNDHKLKDVLAIMRRAGRVRMTQVGQKRMEWSAP